MRAEVGILVKPPSLKAAMKAINRIRRLRPNALLLNLPENVNDIVLEFIANADFNEFMEEVGRKLPKPATAWIKEYEPILKELPAIGDVSDIICYGDPIFFKKSAEKAIELAILTAKTMITEKINVEAWLKILKDVVEEEKAALEREGEKIVELSEIYERSICLSNFSAKQIKEKLKEKGIKSWIEYLGQPHHFTPLEVLKRTLMKREISREEAEALIKEHLKFIQEYIYRKPFLKAIDEWNKRKLYWIPKNVDEE